MKEKKLNKVNDIISWLDTKDNNGMTGLEKVETIKKIDITDILKNINHAINKYKNLELQTEENQKILEEAIVNSKKINNKIDEIEEFHKKSLKEKIELKEEFIEEIDKAKKELSNISLKHDELKNIQKEAKEILGISTSAGLATSYKEKIDRLNKEIKQQQTIFFWINISLLVIIVIFNIFTRKFWFEITDYKQFLSRLAMLGSISLPAIWIAKQNGELLRENLHTLEEYEHKKTLIDTYVGYKATLEAININIADEEGQGTDKAILELINETTKGIIKNPSLNMSKSKKEKMPLEDVLLSLTDKINGVEKNIKSIPDTIKRIIK